VSRDVRFVVVDTPEGAAAAAAERLAAAVRGGGQIALAGGSTPKKAYGLAVEREPDWSRAHLWFGDERAVPPDDERSNYRMVREALLDRLATPPAAIHRMRGELPAADAAAEYDRELAGTTLDLALLGLGPDGHTASLFPGKPAVAERERLAVPSEPGLDPRVDRVTLTVPALNAAGSVLFLVVGADKAEAAARAFGGDRDAATPASLVRSTHGETVAILDCAAASALDIYI
jgi:6-phosphogluconolactonase